MAVNRESKVRMGFRGVDLAVVDFLCYSFGFFGGCLLETWVDSSLDFCLKFRTHKSFPLFLSILPIHDIHGILIFMVF